MCYISLLNPQLAQQKKELDCRSKTNFSLKILPRTKKKNQEIYHIFFTPILFGQCINNHKNVWLRPNIGVMWREFFNLECLLIEFVIPKILVRFIFVYLILEIFKSGIIFWVQITFFIFEFVCVVKLVLTMVIL